MARIERPMSVAEHDAMIRKMESILVRVGVSCTRKQAKDNNCITCTEMYKRFDKLRRHAASSKHKEE